MEKLKARKRFRFDKRFILILFLGVVTVGMFDVVTYTQSSQDIRSRAYDAAFCADKCTGQDRCGNGPPGDPNYNDPCCADLKRTGDPFACPWPQRGYCTDDQCASIPAGVDRQRCGGPRHSWCNLCIDNGCPGYGNAPPPTKPPRPTNPPRPTVTSPPRPTSTPYLPPSSPPGLPSSTPPPYVSATPVPPEETTPTEPYRYVSPTEPVENQQITPPQESRQFIPTHVQQQPPPSSKPSIALPIDKIFKGIGDFVQQSKNTLYTFITTILP